MHDFRHNLINNSLNKVLQRLHHPLEVMLTCVCWYSASPLRLRPVDEMKQERGVFVDHSTVHRWAMKILRVLAAAFLRRKRNLGSRWRMDETYIKVVGQWKYLCRAVDKGGANTASIESVKADACVDILMRQSKYLNNHVEQDHRAVNRITGPMLGFKFFWSAQKLIAVIEIMHMIKMGQMNCPEGSTMSAADQFYSVAV